MPRVDRDFVTRMSLWKQAILCLVLLVAVLAGWYVYQNPDIAGLARESATGSGGQQAGGQQTGVGRTAAARTAFPD